MPYQLSSERFRRLAGVLVASDDARTRHRLSRIVSGDMALVATARSADEALELAVERGPQVCVVALDSPEQAEATLEEILDAVPGVRVILLSSLEDRNMFLEAMRAGAAGYMGVDTADDALASAVKDVLAGRAAVSPELLPALIGELHARRDPGG